MSKETYYKGKRDLLRADFCEVLIMQHIRYTLATHLQHIRNISNTMCTRGSVGERVRDHAKQSSKETYYRGKRDLLRVPEAVLASVY